MTENDGKKICPYCAEEIKAEAIKCRYCGSDLTVPPDTGLRVIPIGESAPIGPSIVPLGEGSILSQKYQIVRMIGKGGMGCVYEAREVDFNVDRTVAIKILMPSYIQNEKSLRRFEHEIKVAARLDHPNIVPIYNIGSEGDMLYFVMKHITGPTLKDRIRSQGVLKEKEIRNIAVDVADALGYMHDQGCIHRDIKANNIMVDGSGHPILMDFGISKVAGGEMLTTEGEILGTATYMAPEQWNGEIDHRSDIYSFGCVLYEMATGMPPFISDSIPELMRMHMNDPVPPIEQERSDLNTEFCNTIYRCLSKSPIHRFQTMGELKLALENEEAVTGAVRPALAGDVTVSLSSTPKTQTQQRPGISPILSKANRLAEKGRIDEAVEALQKELEKNGPNPDIEPRLLELEMLQGNMTDALGQAEAHLLKMEHRQALNVLKNFLAAAPSVRILRKKKEIEQYIGKTDKLFRQAQAFHSREKLGMAKSVYEKVLLREPGMPEAKTALKEIGDVPSETPRVVPVGPIVAGAILLVLLILLMALPWVIPNQVAGAYLATGDAMADWGWYRLPPFFNAMACYERARGTSGRHEFKSQVDQHWNKMYSDILYYAKTYGKQGERRKAVRNYRALRAVAEKLHKPTAWIDKEIARQKSGQ